MGVLPNNNIDEFVNLYYPRDGDNVSIFLKPNDVNTFKPIRIDFDILEIKSSLINNITIIAQMKVPGLWTESQQFFEDLSSFDTLNGIADELSLGFASNADVTEDAMNWINPFNTSKQFIEDVCLASYKDEDSFFTCYIDFFYYMNFVNVNNQFSEERETEESKMVFGAAQDLARGSTDQLVKTVPHVLTNHPQWGGTNSHINLWTLLNNTGAIWQQNGYRRYAQFFDMTEDEFFSSFVEPLNTEDIGDTFQLLKGRPGEEDFFNAHNKYKYLGIQNANVHDNYLHSIINNTQNLIEINKLVLHIELEVVNFNLYKYQRIPIIIFETNEEIIDSLKQRDKNVGELEEDAEDNWNDTIWFNRIISGYYVIKDVVYKWNRGDNNIRQELKLVRREWPFQFSNDQRTNTKDLS